MLLAPLRRGHPFSIQPRRIVAHVLLMAAIEFGNPVAIFILVIADDLSLDASWLFHTLPILFLAAAHTSELGARNDGTISTRRAGSIA